jgi:signal transduction histidine kinase
MAEQSNSGSGSSDPARFFSDAAARISAAFGAPRASDALPPDPAILVALFDSLPEGVIACDPDGRLIFSNVAAERFLDPAARPGDMEWWINGTRTVEIDGRPRADGDATPLARALAGERFADARLAVRAADGSLRLRAVSGGPIRDGDGRFAGAVLVVRDVTDRVAADRRRGDAGTVEAIGRLGGGIAHDLNNVIQVVAGNLDLIKRRPAPEALDKMLATTDAALERAGAMAQGLLALAKPATATRGIVGLDDLLPRVASSLRVALGSAIRVEVRVAPGIAAVRVDAASLEEAIRALASRARDVMGDGGTLAIAAASPDFRAVRRAGLGGVSYVAVSVSDTGEAVPEADLARAFDPYSQPKSARTLGGLELCAVRAFALRSGGEAVARPAAGGGATFTLLLPAAGAAIGDEPVAPDARTAVAGG